MKPCDTEGITTVSVFYNYFHVREQPVVEFVLTMVIFFYLQFLRIRKSSEFLIKYDFMLPLNDKTCMVRK